MKTFHRARNCRLIKDDIYNYKAVIHRKINCSGIASTHWSHWFGCLAVTELSFHSVRLVLTLSPLSEYPFIAKAENSGKAVNDDDFATKPSALAWSFRPSVKGSPCISH